LRKRIGELKVSRVRLELSSISAAHNGTPKTLKNAAGLEHDEQSTAWLPDNRARGSKSSSRIGMSRQMVERYTRYRDQMQVAAAGQAPLRLIEKMWGLDSEQSRQHISGRHCRDLQNLAGMICNTDSVRY
jgi:hypothetical protein